MDGELDSNTMLLDSTGIFKLYVGWQEPVLYVATQSAQTNGNDMFIFISDARNDLIPAPWAKAGQVAEWSAYLANESTNNWNGWFDQSGTSENASGDYLEGTINVQEEFGHSPSKIYIAVGQYGTNDNGTLVSQIPQGNLDGNIDQDELKEFDFVITSAPFDGKVIKNYKLFQNYPNPFNPRTTIQFALPKAGMVSLKVYNILGEVVAELINREMNAGFQSVNFNASNLSSGLYFYKIKAYNFVDVKKMLLLK